MESEKYEETTKAKRGRRGKVIVKEEKAPASPAVSGIIVIIFLKS